MVIPLIAQYLSTAKTPRVSQRLCHVTMWTESVMPCVVAAHTGILCQGSDTVSGTIRTGGSGQLLYY
jgi:hypothetical protein